MTLLTPCQCPTLIALLSDNLLSCLSPTSPWTTSPRSRPTLPTCCPSSTWKKFLLALLTTKASTITFSRPSLRSRKLVRRIRRTLTLVRTLEIWPVPSATRRLLASSARVPKSTREVTPARNATALVSSPAFPLQLLTPSRSRSAPTLNQLVISRP